ERGHPGSKRSKHYCIVRHSHYRLWGHRYYGLIGNNEPRNGTASVKPRHLVTSMLSSIADDLNVIGINRATDRTEPSTNPANPGCVTRVAYRGRAGVNDRLRG